MFDRYITEMRIIETNDPDFLGPYMDQVLMTENGPETLRDKKNGDSI